MLQHKVKFHWTVQRIDIDLAEVFAPSIRAIFGERATIDEQTG